MKGKGTEIKEITLICNVIKGGNKDDLTLVHIYNGNI